MADESASTNRTVFITVRNLVVVNPNHDILKTFPQGIIELALRGTTLISALISLICAVACQAIIRNQSELRTPTSLRLEADVSLTAGWVIFLSFWVALYQFLAIIQLFLHTKIINMIVPGIKLSVFFLVDVIAIGIAAVGYFSGALAMAVYVDQSGRVSNDYTASAGATTAFSFLTVILSIGMIGYFLMAHYVLKWSTHAYGESKNQRPSQDGQQVD